jgi:hypothetical protein
MILLTFFYMASAEEVDAISWPATEPVEPWYTGRSVRHSDVLRLQAIVAGSPLPGYVEEPARTLLGLDVDPDKAVFKFPADLVQGLAKADTMKLRPVAKKWLESIPPRDDDFTLDYVSLLMHKLRHLACLAVESGRDMYMYLSDDTPLFSWGEVWACVPEEAPAPAADPTPTRRPEMQRIATALIERVSVRGGRRRPLQRDEALVGVDEKS